MPGKLYKDIPRMLRNLIVIEQYNNFTQMGAKEEIDFIRNKVNNLINIKDSQELIKEFTWCANTINIFYNEIDPEFKKHFLEEERRKEKEE